MNVEVSEDFCDKSKVRELSIVFHHCPIHVHQDGVR